jgi:hypothetical protein
MSTFGGPNEAWRYQPRYRNRLSSLFIGLPLGIVLFGIAKIRDRRSAAAAAHHHDDAHGDHHDDHHHHADHIAEKLRKYEVEPIASNPHLAAYVGPTILIDYFHATRSSPSE